MIKNEFIKIKWHNKNKKHLENKGYIFTNYGDEIVIKTIDLPQSSNIKIHVKCDTEECNNENYIKFQDYNKCVNKNDGVYICISCGHQKRKETCLEKYGFETLLQNKELMTEYIKNIYGVDNYAKTNEFKEYYKKYCQETYGVDNIFQLDDIKTKSKLTCIEKFGYEYHLQNEIQKEKYCIGENSPSWVDGRSYIDRRYIKENRLWRFKVYEKDKFTCQCCDDNTGGNLVAHHLYSWDVNESKRYDIDNGITLCNQCHIKFHSIYGYGNNTKEQFYEFLNKRCNDYPVRE